MLTSALNCCLIDCSESNGIGIVSYGNISDSIGQKRDEADYSIMLSSHKNYVAALVYENVVKIIPIVSAPNSKGLMLEKVFNVRVRHANSMLILPLFNYEITAVN